MNEPLDLSTLDGTIEVAKAAARRYRELPGKQLAKTVMINVDGDIAMAVADRKRVMRLTYYPHLH